jgi:hypothetical protein
MNDSIFESFLETQHRQAMRLAEESDLLDVFPIGHKPYQRHILRYRCNGLVREEHEVRKANHFEVGIRFPLDYLRRAEPPEVITWFRPVNVWHPNILHPFLCPGRLSPGTSLIDLIYQCFDIITYNKVTMNELDCLNPDACSWSRSNIDRFPIDSRPLKRRSLALHGTVDAKMQEDRW